MDKLRCMQMKKQNTFGAPFKHDKKNSRYEN